MVYEEDVADTLRSHPRPGSNSVGALTYSKAHGAASTEDSENWEESDEARTLNSFQHATDVVVEAEAFESRVARNGRGAPSADVPPLKAESGSTGKGDGAPLVMAVSENQRRELRESDHAPSLGEPSGHMGQGLPSVRTGAAVRRLTPKECERLQGFPDEWTRIDGDDTPDGPRYAALGDAVTVNVARWVIARLVKREALS
jgi:DNA (cytosine-5)-methyltransferase 1